MVDRLIKPLISNSFFPFRTGRAVKAKSGFDVDRILSKGRANILVEMKSTNRIDPTEVAHLASNTADISQITDRYYISLDTAEVRLAGVHCMPWNRFLDLFFFWEIAHLRKPLIRKNTGVAYEI